MLTRAYDSVAESRSAGPLSISMVKSNVTESNVRSPLSGGKKSTQAAICVEVEQVEEPVRPGLPARKKDVVAVVKTSPDGNEGPLRKKPTKVRSSDAGMVNGVSSVMVALIVSP